MKRIARAVAAAVVVTGIGVVGGAGTAMAGPCEARQTSAAFAPWGDHNQYFVANGGTFEPGSTRWDTWGGARVTGAQSPFAINGRGVSAMQLPAWSTAVSPPMCVFHNEESLRFFYRAPRAGLQLEVYIEVAGEQGYASTTTYVTSTGRGWAVSPIIDMPSLRDADGQQWITVWFTPMGGGRGSWLIDDVMIDPWVAR